MSVESPCKGICNLDFATHTVCQGCGRTVDEIGNWSIYTNEDKMLVNEKAKQRLQGL